MNEPGRGGGRPGTDPYAASDDAAAQTDAVTGEAATTADEAGAAKAPDATEAVNASDAPETRTDGIAATEESPETKTDDAGEQDGEPGQPDGTPTRPTPRRRRRRKRSFWREFPILVAVALLLAVVIKTYALQAFFIPSGSMENTLEVNDRVLVNKLVYHFRGIHRGDIVVFNGDGSWYPGTVPTAGNVFSNFWDNLTGMFGFGHPGVILVKRVIGLPGDHVACCDAQGRVTVNGVPLSESSYLFPGDAPSLTRFNITVPTGQLWVMGDHRSVSEDSRDHLGDPGGGTIPESAVIGRAFIIIWPPSRWRILPIPSTFQQPALNKQESAAGSSGGDAATALVGARLQPEGPEVPLALGFVGAVPVTLLQRQARRSLRSRLRRRRRETA